MTGNSVKLRLTFWNVAVLALFLAAFAVMTRFIVKAKMADSVDSDLADDGHRTAARWTKMSDQEFASRLKSRRNSAVSLPSSAPQSPAPVMSGALSLVSPVVAPGPANASPGQPADDFRNRLIALSGRALDGSSEGPWDGSWRIAATGIETFSTTTLDEQRVRVFSVPLVRGKKIIAVIQLAHSFSEIDRLLNQLTGTLLLLIPGGLIIAGLGGAFLTDRAIRPVRHITHTAAQIGAEDLSRRLPIEGVDEFAELASTFNAMIARLEDAFLQLEAAYEQQRRFTEDASHELRTPLTAIKANASLALSGVRTPVEYRAALEEVNTAASTMNRIVQDLLLLARSDSNQLSLELQPAPIQELFQRVVAGVHRTDAAPIAVSVEPPSLKVQADLHHLSRLVSNLLENALRHTGPQGQIALTAHPDGDYVLIEVKDTGEGIPAEHLPRIFDRFYRVDTARSRAQGGTGLGLSICQSIVKAHHGTITVQSQAGVGTTVTVRLPLAIE